jgi:hypothetical protein
MSATVFVELRDARDGWTAEVRVAEGTSETHHKVRVPRATYERFGAGAADVHDFVRASFAFLLDREPKEAILRSFDIDVIRRYFPEYDREIASYF